MFSGIISFLNTNAPEVFTLFLTVLGGGIDVLWDSTANAGSGGLTNVGEITLLSSIVGLAMFGLRWIRSLIPFVN